MMCRSITKQSNESEAVIDVEAALPLHDERCAEHHCTGEDDWVSKRATQWEYFGLDTAKQIINGQNAFHIIIFAAVLLCFISFASGFVLGFIKANHETLLKVLSPQKRSIEFTRADFFREHVDQVMPKDEQVLAMALFPFQ